MARPTKEPDVDANVMERLAAICCTMTEIAAVTGLSVDTLERRYAEPIKRGREVGKATLRREQYRLAMAGNPTMLIWLGKQLLGQTDKVVTANAGESFGLGDNERPDATRNNTAIVIQ
jgi:hypothetical protein